MKTIPLSLLLILVGIIGVAAQTTAFVGVNVIPMDRERVLSDQTVIVKNGSITEIGPANKVKVPKDAVKIKIQDGWVTLTGQVEWFFQKDAGGN